jgi:hypothetical protein
MATATSLAGSITGMFTKPVEEYKYHRRKRENASKRAGMNQIDESDNAGQYTIENAGSEAGDSINSRGHDPEESKNKSNKSHPSMVGKVVGASAKSIGRFAPKALKGMVVDFPLAITEGMKAVPKHFGDNGRYYAPVTDAKSGTVVAGKSFAWGFVDGISDLVVQPYKGAKEEGIRGAAKGIGKGVVGLTMKSGAGVFGLLAYPSAGIAKSIRSAVYTETRKEIFQMRLKEGEWMAQTRSISQAEREDVVSKFAHLLNQK